MFEHRDGTQSRMGAAGHLYIDGKSAKERYRHKDSGCDRGKCARREQSDARLISERRKVIDARQPDDQIPRMGAAFAGIVRMEGFVTKHPESPRGWRRRWRPFLAGGHSVCSQSLQNRKPATPK